MDRPRRHALYALRHRAGRLDRPDHARVSLRRLRRGGGRRPRACRPPTPPAGRPGQGRDPAARSTRRGDGGSCPGTLRGAPAPPRRRARRQRSDRQALPPPGRNRNAVGVHRRRTDARGRDSHRAGSGLARPGAPSDERSAGMAGRRVGTGLVLATLGLTAAGCGLGSTKTVTATEARTVTTTKTVTTTGSASSAKPCTGGQLAGSFVLVPGSAGAGQIVYGLTLKNRSSSPCSLRGI